MPLLNRKPFSTDQPPSDLDENEKIFICRQTNEVYRDYESFFKRTILCNSLVWSCAITSKHGLTYEEALESEKDAKEAVQLIPVPIQQGVITLVHYTRHSRLDNLCDEVYNYIRDRYQEGEEVDLKYKGEKNGDDRVGKVREEYQREVRMQNGGTIAMIFRRFRAEK